MLRIAYERLLKITVVTSSPSRAFVHSDWSVYIAVPSASRHDHRAVGAGDRRAGGDAAGPGRSRRR